MAPPVEVKISRETPTRAAASRTFTVPTTLSRASNPGSAIERRTSIWAARWKTLSGAKPSIAENTASASATSSSVTDTPASRAPARFSSFPLEKSSSTRTSSPRAAKASARCEPMNPAPPVTTDFTEESLWAQSDGSGEDALLLSPTAETRFPPICRGIHGRGYGEGPQMRLIVTEKNNSAKKIAEILSGGSAKEGASYKTPYYEWTDESGDQMTIGLKGHVLKPAFPESYNNWQETNPRDLIDADLIKEPTDKNVVRALKKVAAEADDLVIATDYDREGELIGLEALQEVVAANPDLATAEGVHEDGTPVKRARYSALTKDEIERAFNNLDELSMPLANAGAARQDMDLIWGATLTRAVSMATRRFGSNFLSVGRVQSPTLGLIVQRELERRAHVPEPFWEVTATFAHPDGSFVAEHTTDRFWDEAEAKAAVENSKSPGTVKEISARKNTRKPPTPLNTTAFTTDASNRLGITPSRAMRIAEDLYMDGYISYPRTDNTVYPKSLDTKELVKQLVGVDEFKAGSFLLDKPSLEATRGKKETTDHPPIYPTQAVNPKRLEARSEAHRRVYELVARRFLATFSPPMVSESTRANIESAPGSGSPSSTPAKDPDLSGETYFVRGSV